MTSRDVAVEVLTALDGDPAAHANVVLPARLGETTLDPRDRAFVSDLVYTTLREQRLVDHLMMPHLRRPLGDLDPEVRAALRLGVTQLRLGVAPHAAVSETVGALGRRSPHSRGFVNAVLRAVARDGPPWDGPTGDDVASLALRTSHPDWLVERLIEELGPTDARAVLAIDNQPPPVTLRPNRLRTDGPALTAELVSAGIRTEAGRLVGDAVLVRGAGDLSALDAVAQGRATPQDQASQAVVSVLDPQPGERVLEIGAAPGGKATAIAEHMNDRGLVAALDVAPGRLARVVEATTRLGLGAVTPLVADGRALPIAPGSFDRVLLDAPCSGLGVLRRRPEARWRVRADAPVRLAELQRTLALTARRALAPGGRFVYSVCTLTAVETTAVDAFLAEQWPQARALPPPGPPWQPVGRGARLLPSACGTDGMYVLALAVG